jgi:hypothetical protein
VVYITAVPVAYQHVVTVKFRTVTIMLSFLRLSSLNFTIFMMKIDVFEHVFTSAYVLQAAPVLYGVRHVEVDVSDSALALPDRRSMKNHHRQIGNKSRLCYRVAS